MKTLEEVKEYCQKLLYKDETQISVLTEYDIEDILSFIYEIRLKDVNLKETNESVKKVQ